MQAPKGYSFVESPDLRQISELINRTWPAPRWNYDLNLLQRHLCRPACDPRLLVGIADGDGELVAFEALVPFEVDFFNARRRAVFASFFTVAPEHQGKGLSLVQEQVLIERAIENGYEIYLVMCEAGARSNQAVKSVFAKLAIPLSAVRSFQYLVASRQVLHSRLPLGRSGRTRHYQPDDRQGLLGLVADMGRGADLRKRIAESDADFVFAPQFHSQTFIFEGTNQLRAAANVLLLEVMTDQGTLINAYFDNVAMGDLSDDEQVSFLGDILSALTDQGFHGAFLPDLGYVPTAPFSRLGFRTAPRRLTLYLAPLQRNAVPIGPLTVGNACLDVF